MESSKEDSDVSSKSFPYLVEIMGGAIVLLEAPRVGIVICKGDKHDVGFRSSIWSNTIPYQGSVTLRN